MREDFRDVYKKFADKYGVHSQIQQCIEEMGELIKELCKYERYHNNNEQKTSEAIDGIKEELADVINMVEQLQYCFGEDDIENIRTKKIEKCKKIYLYIFIKHFQFELRVFLTLFL